MCGRYALALRPSQIRQHFQDYHIPVDEAPDDEGDGAPRQSYNFAPGYHGVVYRADVGDRGAGHRENTAATSAQQQPEDQLAQYQQDENDDDAMEEEPSFSSSSTSPEESQGQKKKKKSSDDRRRYKLQSMKWGLIPFWTKRNPDYAAVLKTINCRDDSLAQPGGMWTTMKKGKRCIVVVEGFYEWLKKGPKEKVPHYVKRKDGKLMLLAGLWDCCLYEDAGGGGGGEPERLYTYTIITTSSNDQLKFLHDRMPVILDPGSEAMKVWLDPERYEWSKELQGILKPYKGQLEVYPVNKEVGKVGNNSPTFVVPVASKENKGNIANFFQAKGRSKAKVKQEGVSNENKKEEDVEVVVKKEDGEEEGRTVEDVVYKADDGGMKVEETTPPKKGIKREAGSEEPGGVPPAKKAMAEFKKEDSASPVKTRPKISAIKNPVRSPAKGRGKLKAAEPGSQKITKFFGNSA